LHESASISPAGSGEVIGSESGGNRFDRIKISEGTRASIHYEAEVETQCSFLEPDNLRKVSPAQMDPALVTYLFPSRYCQSDLLGRFAWQKFGKFNSAYDQVVEITRWTFENVEYLSGTTTSATSAYDTVTQCAGVCRDFAHLGIALCRALTIPARYFTGYACRLEPPDFHACFEAYIGGNWVLFDATRLAPANGLIRIGTGRDAADVSVCTAFGIASLVSQTIHCEATENDFRPHTHEDLETVAVSLAPPGQ